MELCGAASHAEDFTCLRCITMELDQGAAAEGISWNAADGSPNVDTSERTRYATPGQSCGRGVVRKLSTKQVRFIKHLMATRDCRNLVRLPGSEDVENISLRGARDLIDRLLACPELPQTAVKSERLATPKQRDWLVKLSDRDASGDVAATRALAVTEKDVPDGEHTVTFKAASAALDTLFKAPRSQATDALTVGLYRKNGVIIRVQSSRGDSGRMYGKIWRPEMKAFEYVPGAARGFTQADRMTVAEVEEISEMNGMCMMCSKTLTAVVNGVSPAQRIIGPICAAKVG